MPALVPARRAPPRGLRDLRHQAAYLFGAVCPERDAGVALVLPCGGAAAMQAMLDELSAAVAPEAHAVVLMDRAGWHIAKDLAVPANLTPLFLPAYSPELNAIERVWLYLRERFLSHRLWPSYDAILDACCAAWDTLLDEAGRIRSLCSLDWATPVRTNGLGIKGSPWRVSLNESRSGGVNRHRTRPIGQGDLGPAVSMYRFHRSGGQATAT